jgi:hypothetical protein
MLSSVYRHYISVKIFIVASTITKIIHFYVLCYKNGFDKR